MTQPTSFPVGRHYVAHERLGAGGMGTVYRGRSVDDGSTVAIKVLHDELAEDPTFVARFVQERTILVHLRGHGVVEVLDLIVDRGTLAIVMELIPGGSLRQHLTRRGALPAGEAVAITMQVLRGLAIAHAAGILHRDVKPANVLLEFRTDLPIAKLNDFGVSGLIGSGALTRMTGFVGTIDYTAPEVGMGAAATEGVDIYATGMMLYQLLTGRTAFGGGPLAATLRRHMEEAPTRPAGIPDDLWAAISSMISKRPETRPSAAEAALRLANLADPGTDNPVGSGPGSDATAVTDGFDQRPTVMRSASAAGLESTPQAELLDAVVGDPDSLTVLRSMGVTGALSSAPPGLPGEDAMDNADDDSGDGTVVAPRASEAGPRVVDEKPMSTAGAAPATGTKVTNPFDPHFDPRVWDAEETGPGGQDRPEAHRRRPLRLAVIVVCILALCSIAGLGIGLVAIPTGRGYYVGIEPSGDLAIYGGHPGGFLWAHPSIVKHYAFGATQLGHVTDLAVLVTPAPLPASTDATTPKILTATANAPSDSRVVLFTTLAGAQQYVERRHASWQAKIKAVDAKIEALAAKKAAYTAKLAADTTSVAAAMADLQQADAQWYQMWGCGPTATNCSSQKTAIAGFPGLVVGLQNGVIPSVEAASQVMVSVTITPGPAENTLNDVRSCIAAVLAMVQTADSYAQKQATWPPNVSAHSMDTACGRMENTLGVVLKYAPKFPSLITSNWTPAPQG